MQYKRHCQECNEALIGRWDKKFCSDNCRANYYNHLYASDLKEIRNTNRILKNNRRILLSLSESKPKLVSRILLSDKGFNFRYFTSLIKTKAGQEFYQCYEMAFIPEGHHHFYIVRTEKEESSIDVIDVVAQPFEQQ